MRALIRAGTHTGDSVYARGELHAAGRQAINVRCPDQRMTGSAEAVGTQLIAHDEQDIRSFFVHGDSAISYRIVRTWRSDDRTAGGVDTDTAADRLVFDDSIRHDVGYVHLRTNRIEELAIDARRIGIGGARYPMTGQLEDSLGRL